MSRNPQPPAADEARTGMPADEARTGVPADPPARPAKARRKRAAVGQTIGGVLFGFEQQVWRTAPPPHELVHHARPDAPVPAGNGSFVTITMPDRVDVALDDDEEEST